MTVRSVKQPDVKKVSALIFLTNRSVSLLTLSVKKKLLLILATKDISRSYFRLAASVINFTSEVGEERPYARVQYPALSLPMRIIGV